MAEEAGIASSKWGTDVVALDISYVQCYEFESGSIPVTFKAS